jgi:hypothetical protein
MMIKKLLPLLFLFAGLQVNAAVITADDVYSDGNLDWLHFTFTDGTSAAGSLAAYTSDGFRLATATEANDLINSWFGISNVSGNHNNIAADHALSTAFVAEFGGTIGTERSYGIVQDAGMFGARVGHSYQSFSPTSSNWGMGGASSNYAGYMMVKSSSVPEPSVKSSSVPEPSVMALLVLGFIGIGFARRRKA